VDELLSLYSRASEWTTEKVAGVVNDLKARTPCDDWDVRALLNHMLDTQRYFAGTARGEDVSPPSPNPPALLSDDPQADFERGRQDMLDTFGQPGVIERPDRHWASRSLISCCTAGTSREPLIRTRRCRTNSPKPPTA
jgi:hypothetical protein